MKPKLWILVVLIAGSALIAWSSRQGTDAMLTPDVRPRPAADPTPDVRDIVPAEALDGRLSVPDPAGPRTTIDAVGLFDELTAAAADKRPELLESLITRWLEDLPHPVESALDMFERLDDGGTRAHVAGLLLQACMLFAEDLPARDEPWTRASLARELLARSDASPGAALACRHAIQRFASEVPVDELPDLITHTASGELVHGSQDAVLQRMFLINELADGMSPEVVDLLLEQVALEEESDRGRSLAAGALMHRDWREGAARIQELLDDPENRFAGELGLDVRAALGGYFLEMHGRDRLELLREIVDDVEAARMSLCRVTIDEAAELDAMATLEDRAWPEYDWVERALGGSRGFEAGLRIVARLDGGNEGFYAGQVLGDLLLEHIGDPQLSAHLDTRFARRTESSDPYWGTLASIAHRIDVAAVYQEVLPRLQASLGEASASRQHLLRALDARFPELGLSNF